VSREYNVLALIKGKQRYIFVYDDDSRDALIESLRDHAADPRLNFSWFDASVLSDKARQQAAAADAAEDAAPAHPRL
jgi:hypothetical protein